MTDAATLTAVKNKVRHALSRSHRERALEVTHQAQLTPDEVLQVWGGTRDWAILADAVRQGADPDQRIEGAMSERWFLWAEVIQNGHTQQAADLLDLLRDHPKVEAWMDRPFDPGHAFQKDRSLVDALLTRGRWEALEDLNRRYPQRIWPLDAQGCGPWQRIGAHDMTAEVVERFHRWGWLPSPEAIEHATFPLVRPDEQPQVRRYLEQVRQALGVDLQQDAHLDAAQFIQACLKVKPSSSSFSTEEALVLDRTVTDPILTRPLEAWITPQPIQAGKISGAWTPLAALVWATVVQGVLRKPDPTDPYPRVHRLSELPLQAHLAALPADHPVWDQPLLAPRHQPPVTLRGLVDWLGVQEIFAKAATPGAQRQFTRPPAGRMAALLAQAQVFLPRLGARRHRAEAERFFSLVLPAQVDLERSTKDPLRTLLKTTPGSLRERLGVLGQALATGVIPMESDHPPRQTQFEVLLNGLEQAWAAAPTQAVFTPAQGAAVAAFLKQRPEAPNVGVWDEAYVQWTRACMDRQVDPVAVLQRAGCPLTDDDLAAQHPDPDALRHRLVTLRRAQALAQQPVITSTRPRRRT